MSAPAARFAWPSLAGVLARSRLASLTLISWLVILILPAATTFSSWHEWDVNRTYLFLTSCWLLLALRVAFPGPRFFVATYPIALAGALCVGADTLASVDPLELVSQWRTFSALDVESAVGPYVVPAAVAAVLLAAMAWLGYRFDARTGRGRWTLAAFAASGAFLAIAAPGVSWVRAWPVNAALVVATTATQSRMLALNVFPYLAAVDPRDPQARWNAALAAAPKGPENLVFVIGEGIRADFLHECGGPGGVRRVAPGALVACDVTAGSDATHTSVPLLVSRELPGHGMRVSSDATFLHAFSEAGFETYWYTVQGLSLAWPDAEHEKALNGNLSDRAELLPPIAATLADGHRLRAIVVHAYNAHEPYGMRFDPAKAPYQVACGDMGERPTRATLECWKKLYADAVDESVRFLNALIAMLDKQPGQAFLLFTPDHGENFLDDGRGLVMHALRHPTRWDIRVPAVFWANDAWKRAHAGEWAMLEKNAGAPLMHADMVPTFLAAAGIRYDEPRRIVVDLLDREVPPRERIVEESLGSATDWQALVREAR